MKKSKAFSLVELSVVLLVILLMSVGVLQGTSAIKQARITNARSITSTSPVPTTDGLVAWYEPTLTKSFKTNELENGSQITTWYDISPGSVIGKKNSLTVTASNNITMSSNGINKLPSVQFGGAGGIVLSNFYQGTSTQNTIFFVVQPFIVTNNSVIVDAGQTSNIAVFGIFSPSSFQMHFGTNYVFSTSPLTFTGGDNYIGAVYYNSTSSKAYINDALNISGGSMFNAGSNILTGIKIGSDRNNDAGFNGLISEIIVYNRVLNLQERKDIMRYLSKKYGVAVANL